jgi:hypothetical protein
MTAFKIWMEGYLATGMEGFPATAVFIGTIEAETFQQACDKLFSHHDKYYDPERRTVYGCRLFDNEQDARKTFG